MRELEEDLWTDLTEVEEKYLDRIEDCIVKEGLPPTRAELARHFGVYPNAADEIVKKLAKKGRIEIRPNISRGIRLVIAQ